MTAEKDYLDARLKAAEARARMTLTGRELKERLAPKTIAETAWESVKEKGEALADRSVETARAHPRAVAGAGVAATALFLRRPIVRGLKALFSRSEPPPADTTE